MPIAGIDSIRIMEESYHADPVRSIVSTAVEDAVKWSPVIIFS